jgi:hypothetical protein
MSCPVCGKTMNHHADKVDYSANSASGEKVDQDLGGVICEVYSCPKCGNIELVGKR